MISGIDNVGFSGASTGSNFFGSSSAFMGGYGGTDAANGSETTQAATEASGAQGAASTAASGGIQTSADVIGHVISAPQDTAAIGPGEEGQAGADPEHMNALMANFA